MCDRTTIVTASDKGETFNEEEIIRNPAQLRADDKYDAGIGTESDGACADAAEAEQG